ncbi:MAG TPA: LysR substrate-binding domain-containing protein, partial [Gemmatimonadaceae bacterium]|nr:LysR substrate-binding domain-containing protein [Gemmatimonadaceae bacterium]
GCVSTANSAPTGFVAEHLGAMNYECVAAPGFAKSYFSAGMILHEVLAAPAVLFNRKDGLHATFLESLFGFSVDGYAQHYFPSPIALLSAIRSGIGYGLVPSMQAKPLLDSGDLIALAPHNRIAVDLYWHHWEVAPPNAMAISEVVVRQARQVLIQSPLAPSDRGAAGDVEN